LWQLCFHQNGWKQGPWRDFLFCNLYKSSKNGLSQKPLFQNRKTCLSLSLIVEHFPGTVTDFTACSLPPPSALPLIYSQKSDVVVLFYFIYLHVSKSIFIYLPLLQTTVYVPHPRTELLWCHFIKKDVTGRIYASRRQRKIKHFCNMSSF
jgi:hypothetical protein